MASENPMATIAKWIVNYEEHEKNLEKEIADKQGYLAATRLWLAKFRDLLATLEASNQSSIDILERDPDTAFQNERGTHFERIKAFMLSEFNEPQTVAEIEQGTKIPRTSISAVLYRTHSDQFESQYFSGQRGKAWCIRTEKKESLDETPILVPPSFVKDLFAVRDKLQSINDSLPQPPPPPGLGLGRLTPRPLPPPPPPPLGPKE